MRSLVLGHRGMVGSAILRLLPSSQTCKKYSPDLRDQEDAEIAFSIHDWKDVDVLYLCAARVGGIQRNLNEPGQMIYDNLMIQCNVIEAARLAGVKLIVFLGSSCIYPTRFMDMDASPFATGGLRKTIPLTEDELLGGKLEPSNEPYAIAKIAGIKMLEAYHRQYGMEFLAVMPCNLYGPGDNYDPENSHFIPGMIRKFHDAKVSGSPGVTLWGSGSPRREVMHVDDCARIIVELVRIGARGIVNIGPGVDQTIRHYAEVVQGIVGYKGAVAWQTNRPDGVARKLLDVSKMRGFGIEPWTMLTVPQGIAATYEAFLKEHRG